MNGIEARLTCLESQLRIQRRITLFLLTALAVLVGLGAAHPVPDVVRAKRFEMVDDSGTPLVALRPTSQGGAIGVFNSQGGVAGVFTADETGGGLLNVLSREGRNGVLVLGSNADGSGGALTVFNREEREVITLRPDSRGLGIVGAWDGHGQGSMLRAVPEIRR